MHRQLAIGLLVLASASGCGSSGSGAAITPVYEWLVAFATETGEWVAKKAATFAAAVEAAWGVLWGESRVNGVLVDEDDPRRGTYDGVLKCAVSWLASHSNDRENRLEIELDHPRMIRDSHDTEAWKLAPEEKQRLEDLRDQLLKV